MNLPTVFIRITLAVTLAVAAVGCKKSKPGLTPIPGQGTVGNGYDNGPAGSMMSNPSNSGMGSGRGFDNNNFSQGTEFGNEDNNSLPNNLDDFANKAESRLDSSTVYFDFDRYNVNADELPKIVTVANILKDKPAAKLRIEGHCDERGTEEYNRTLGERRALSVRDVLVKEGIAASRITTESWGEDKPAAEGSDESAYSKNRRGEFILLQ
jgi:peptidoglycan-associated lipoprotein